MQPAIELPADALPRALRRSLGLHLRWLTGAATAGTDDGVARPASRALKLAAALPPYTALQLAHVAGFAADRLFYSAERGQEVPAPLFVLGIPRSGTTFVHRLLAEDSARFSSMRTWEALLAPSVSERRLWQTLGAADAALGGAGRRLRDALVRRAVGDFDAVHPVSADDAEEDYLALLPLAGCFLAALAAPERAELWRLATLDRAPETERALLLGAYRRILQKHCFASGDGRQLLSKNAAFASWAGALAEAFPDAQFIVCIREPEAALTSQLSAIAGASRALGNDRHRGRALRRHLRRRIPPSSRQSRALFQAHGRSRHRRCARPARRHAECGAGAPGCRAGTGAACVSGARRGQCRAGAAAAPCAQ